MALSYHTAPFSSTADVSIHPTFFHLSILALKKPTDGTLSRSIRTAPRQAEGKKNHSAAAP
jgi:hypothetical protein